MLHTKAVNECLCVCINGGNESKERGRRKFNLHEEKTSCIYPENQAQGPSAGHY